ncbi:MAG: glucosyltransferase domain-containing protein [Lachnospiraceae bacterium]|nr:glucosyltransferase domain-containing protein [Lachnospiraceae bacterium]
MKNVTQTDDFLKYCRKRKLYLGLIFVLTLAVYGIWIMHDYVTFDAEGFYSIENGNFWYTQWLILGRWFFVVLKKLLGVKLINPFFAIGIFLICFPLSSFIWGYVFACWTQKSGRAGDLTVNCAQVIFDILYLTHPVWAHQYAYRNQMEVITLVMVLLPVSLLITTKWLKNNSVFSGLVGFVLVVCCFSGYQSFVIVYLCAMVVYLFLQVLCDQVDHRGFWIQVLKICIFSLLAYMAYSISGNLMCRIRHLDRGGYDAYLLSQIRWKTDPISECIRSCGRYIKMVFLGDADTFSCLYALEFVFGFILLIVSGIGKKLQAWKRFWIPVLFFGIFASALCLDMMTAGNAVIRQEFAYVFSLAFVGMLDIALLFRLLNKVGNRSLAQLVCGVLLLVIGLNQMQTDTRLLFSDYRRATVDYEIFSELYYDALEDGAAPGSALVFVGAHADPKEETTEKREIIGVSYLEILGLDDEKAMQAMQAYGFDISLPTDEQKAYAASIADQLGIWPSESAVRIEEGLIIVRLS